MPIPLHVAKLLTILLALFGVATSALGQTHLDNQTQYSNQNPENETRRSEHFRTVFGYYNRTRM